MKYLVDTHIFLWWLNNDKRLKNFIKTILADQNNLIMVSVVTAWEINIKLMTGNRLKLKTTIKDCFDKSGFEILDIKLSHVLYLPKLANHHKDPFDRMLIAQSQEEGLTLITLDEKMLKYQVKIL